MAAITGTPTAKPTSTRRAQTPSASLGWGRAPSPTPKPRQAKHWANPPHLPKVPSASELSAYANPQIAADAVINPTLKRRHAVAPR